MHLPGPGRLSSPQHEYSCDLTLSHLPSPCSRSELLSQRVGMGCLMSDYVPKHQVEQICVSRADCTDSFLPLTPEGLLCGQESISEWEFSGTGSLLSPLILFVGYGVPQPCPLHHPSLDVIADGSCKRFVLVGWLLIVLVGWLLMPVFCLPLSADHLHCSSQD